MGLRGIGEVVMNEWTKEILRILFLLISIIVCMRISDIAVWYIKLRITERYLEYEQPMTLKEFLSDWGEDD